MEESLVHGTVYCTETGEQVATVAGDWRGLVELCKDDEVKEVLLDMRDWSEPKASKIVPSIDLQGDLESRRLWRLLTRSLAGYMSEIDPDSAKSSVEDWARGVGEQER